MESIGKLFGAGNEEAKALAKAQREDIDRRRAQEKASTDEQLALLRTMQGRATPTLFKDTGAAGVTQPKKVLG